MKEKIGNVYKETNYEAFKHLPDNRQVKDSRKEKIISSINEVGYVKSPIIVNENMEIIDGEGRFAACKKLSLPIMYFVAEGTGIKECVAMNISSTTWKMIDYIEMYAKRGNKNYIRFLRLIEQFPEYNNAEFLGIMNGRIVTGGWKTSLIKTGNLILTEENYQRIVPVLLWIDDLKPVIDKIPGINRVKRTALAWIIEYTSCDKKRLKEKLFDKYPLISPVVDEKPSVFLNELSEIYNKGLRAEKCIFFDSEYKMFLKIQD